MGIEQRIANSRLVTDIFGCWPTFHDAEIVSLSLERDGDTGPQLIATIRAHEMTCEVDLQGHFVHKNKTVVRIQFSGIKELELFDFNGQNALSNLQIDEVPEAAEFQVVFNGIYGLNGTVRCQRIGITAVEPY